MSYNKYIQLRPFAAAATCRRRRPRERGAPVPRGSVLGRCFTMKVRFADVDLDKEYPEKEYVITEGKIREYLAAVSKDERLSTVLLETGDGAALSVRRRDDRRPDTE